jgi:ABC-type transport system involved in multi-copper enzyme maturation permease subunit
VAIYDQTYQPWNGIYGRRAGRIWAMVRLEIVQPFKNVWVLIVVLSAFALVMAWLLLLFIALAQGGPAGKALEAFLTGNWLYSDGFYNFPVLREQQPRNSNTLSLFSVILMFLSATVGSSLISRDMKYNALLMYFSRAITRADYLAGKFLTLILFLLFVTFVPGLLLFAGSLGMASETLTVGDHARDLLGIFLHSIVLVVPMASASLAFSSLTKRPYVAAILWATLFFSSWIFSGVLLGSVRKEWCRLVSWANLASHLGNLCYPQRRSAVPLLAYGWGWPLGILATLTVVSIVVAWWRIRTVEAVE